MSKSLPAPSTNLEAITRFILKADIVLTAEQESLLERLTFVDEKLRSRKFDRDEIINMTKTRFGVSQWRVEQDITDVHALFGRTRKVNKNYVLAQHIEDIMQQIQTCKSRGRMDLLPKLNDNLTYALNSLKDDEAKSTTQPLKIVFINNQASPESLRTVQEVVAEAQKLLDDKESEDYIDYENIDDADTDGDN